MVNLVRELQMINFTHNEIKTKNIIVDESNNGVKLINFGILITQHLNLIKIR